MRTGSALGGRITLQAVEDLPAVHVRQAEVQRDGVGLQALGGAQAGVSAGDQDHAIAAAGEVAPDKFRRPEIVLDDQDQRPGNIGPAWLCRGRGHPGKTNDEGAALAWGALHPDRAAVQFHQPLGDGQAQARAFLFALGCPRLLVRLEDALMILGGDPDARIPDGELQLQPELPRRHRHQAAFGVNFTALDSRL
jgi:hypothetical protein